MGQNMLEWFSKQSKRQKCDKNKGEGSNCVGMIFLVNLTKKWGNISEFSNYVGFLSKANETNVIKSGELGQIILATKVKKHWGVVKLCWNEFL